MDLGNVQRVSAEPLGNSNSLLIVEDCDGHRGEVILDSQETADLAEQLIGVFRPTSENDRAHLSEVEV